MTIGSAWVAVTLATLCVTPCMAIEPRWLDFWSCENVASCFARSGDRLIVAGGFQEVGPSLGHGIVFDRLTAAVDETFPEVAGTVTAVISDGDGGFYLGGAFVAVAGTPRAGLAHIRADGSLGSWAPRANAPVRTLSRNGPVIYLGGSFSLINGERRRCLAAVDALTGNLLDWNPDPDSIVETVVADSEYVFVGGRFDSVGSVPRRGFACFDGPLGRLSSWNARVEGSVYAISRVGSTLFVGGSFWQVGVTSTRNLVAFDLDSKLLTPWRPRIEQPESRTNYSVEVRHLVPGFGTMYVAGKFMTVDGVRREALAEIDLATGVLTNWDPGVRGFDYPEYIIPSIQGMAVDDTSVWIAGNFHTAGYVGRRFAAQIERGTGNVTPWNPQPWEWVKSLALDRDGGRVFVGGEFTSHGPAEPRNNLAFFRGTERSLDPLVVAHEGFSIEAIAARGDTLYAGGLFWMLGGEPRQGLGAIDLRTGRALAWRADLNGHAYRLVLEGDDLYVCGTFTMAAGQPRSNVARFDTRTGELSPWNPLPNSTVYDLSVSGDDVYLCGFFSRVGADTTGPLAVVDRIDGSLKGPNFGQKGIIEAVAVVDSTLFAGGVMYTATDPTRHALAAFDTRSGHRALSLPPMKWSQSTQLRVHTIERVGDTLYFGGAVDTVGGRFQAGGGAIHVRTGQLLEWNPGFFGRQGESGVIWGIRRLNDLLAIGGYFKVAAGHTAGGVALFSLAEPDTSPPEPPPSPTWLGVEAIFPNPVVRGATIRFQMPRTARVTLAIYDLAGRRVRTLLEGALHAAGVQDVPLSTVGLPKGVYLCRLDAGSERSARKFVVLD